MDIDVRDCPLATIEGLQKVCILIEPGDVENAKMIANAQGQRQAILPVRCSDLLSDFLRRIA